VEKLIEAYDEYKKAKHLLKVTYPVTKDPKLLLGVIENIHNSMHQAIAIQKQHLQSTNSQIMATLQELKEITAAHKKSPMAFQRKDKFIICNQDYLMKEISAPKVKQYLEQNYQLLHDVLTLLNRNK
tara:strand:- start:302 stop:682 length:381 start_codon:yes stop_codon:yes gene_type:complete